MVKTIVGHLKSADAIEMFELFSVVGVYTGMMWGIFHLVLEIELNWFNASFQKHK